MNLRKWKWISIVFCLILGTLLHFTFQWSGQNPIVGIFSAVNESTWEHLKLVFFPMFLIGLIGYFIFGKSIDNYIKGNCLGIICGVSFLTIFFYTYTGIIGQNFAIANILSFAFAVFLGENVTCKILEKNQGADEKFYLEIIGVLLICFVMFTFYPPKINYFSDPITNTYGIQR